MIKKIVFLLIPLLLIGAIYYFNSPVVTNYSESIIDTMLDPIQTPVEAIDDIIIPLKAGKVIITPIAEYKIAAIILSKRKYTSGWGGKIAPVDLALGWGKLVDPKLKKYIKYSQTLRFYMYRYKIGTPLSGEYIAQHSANNHIVPANKNLRKAVKRLKKNQIVELKGYLIKISGTYKKRNIGWNSSTTRKDTGNGACELLYLTELKVNNKIYN